MFNLSENDDLYIFDPTYMAIQDLKNECEILNKVVQDIPKRSKAPREWITATDIPTHVAKIITLYNLVMKFESKETPAS